MQAERVCYICGSPDHLARDCLENVGPGPYGGPHPGMFGPGNHTFPYSACDVIFQYIVWNAADVLHFLEAVYVEIFLDLL